MHCPFAKWPRNGNVQIGQNTHDKSHSHRLSSSLSTRDIGTDFGYQSVSQSVISRSRPALTPPDTIRAGSRDIVRVLQ